MATTTINFLLSILLLANRVLALQVTPNSPCASVCLDDPTLDASDPTSSNTIPADIVCQNDDYNNTAVGRKFESCLDCLQTSTHSSLGEDDQSWFLYNLRYALDTCLFSFENSTDATSTPCNLQTSCGPLQESLENGNLNPANESTYSYCSADNNALLGSYLPGCVTCLQDVSNEDYLANFLTALQAGCVQQPPSGTNIGLRGNIFSSTRITITYPGDNPNPPKATHKVLTEAAIIGIAVGLAVLFLIAAAVTFICCRKRRHTRSMKRLASPLDSQFGSKAMSPSNGGGYGNPYASPPTQISQRFDASSLSGKEVKALGLEMPNFSKQYSSSMDSSKEGWQDAHAHFEATQNLLSSHAALPAHQAYIPANYGPVSPAESTNTTNTVKSYQVSSYASSRTSPKNVPPGPPAPIIKIPQKRASIPQQVEQSKSLARTSVVPKVQPVQPAPGLQRDGMPRASTIQKPLPHRISLNTKVHPVPGLPRDPTPVEGQVTQFPPRQPITLNTNLPAMMTLPRDPTPIEGQVTQFPPRPSMALNTSLPTVTSLSRDPTPIEGLPQFPSRTISPLSTQLPQFHSPLDMTSQAPRPGLHSQQQAHPYDSAPPSRSHSRARSWKRSGSRDTIRDTSTERTTTGGWKRSGSRGTIRDTSTERTTTGGWKRSGSRGTIRDTSTERTTTGGWKRSGSRGTIRDTSTERPAAPVRISGPMINHRGRLDFEAQEQEMREREESLRRGPDATPSSAEGPEQWPGTY